MGTWNYRLMVTEHLDEISLGIHEVYYDNDGTPNGYLEKEAIVSSEDLEGIRWQLKMMNKALEKPILWNNEDKFPQEYKINQ